MSENKRNKTGLPSSDNFFNKYFVAVLAVGITFVITILISPIIPPDISSLFLIAVMVSAWHGGLGAGLFATALSASIDIFVFLPPSASMSLDNGDFVQLIVDVFAAVVIGTLSASRKTAQEGRKKSLLLEGAARIEAERADGVKDEFLAAVSHELRTPLTTIKTLTGLLLRKDPPREKRRSYLEDISSECDRQIDFVHNLLDLSRIKSGGVRIKFEPVDVGEVLRVCEKIERVEAAELNHQITIDAPPDLPLVRADRDALRRVVCSVVENAVKYTSDGGRIRLKAYQDSTGENIVIEISDNGSGISEDDLPHVFESFYRGRGGKETFDEREFSGVGLGLYLARSLVEAMNGEISVKSRTGHGSAFTINLPVWQKPAVNGDWTESEKAVEPERQIQSR